MNLNNISKNYTIRKLKPTDLEAILELFLTNPDYSKHCPPVATFENIAEDMEALPPNKTIDDKIYIGYFKNDKLVAILDLILNYPEENIAFVGLFMINKDYQSKGLGSLLISELSDFLAVNNFSKIRLAYAKTNESAKKFWLKNHFELLNIEKQNDGYIAVLMEKNCR